MGGGEGGGGITLVDIAGHDVLWCHRAAGLDSSSPQILLFVSQSSRETASVHRTYFSVREQPDNCSSSVYSSVTQKPGECSSPQNVL